MKKSQTEVLCIGMGVADILVKGVSKISLNGQTHFTESIDIKPGGDAVNEAITLANLSHKTGLMTLVGNDTQGDMLIKSCVDQGLHTEGITVSDRYPTSTSVVLIADNGERSFLSRKGGAADEYSLEDIDLSLIREGVKVVSIASLFCSERLNDAELCEILKKAKSVGAVTIADLVLNRADCSLDELKGALSYLDYIVPSRDEAEHFTGKTELSDIAAVFREYGVKNVVIKLGADGVYAKTDSQQVMVPTMAAEVVDTTGAGDNFMAGFISGLLRGLSLRDCLEFGSGVSAISIGHVGATGAIKSRDQVELLIKEVNNR